MFSHSIYVWVSSFFLLTFCNIVIAHSIICYCIRLYELLHSYVYSISIWEYLLRLSSRSEQNSSRYEHWNKNPLYKHAEVSLKSTISLDCPPTKQHLPKNFLVLKLSWNDIHNSWFGCLIFVGFNNELIKRFWAKSFPMRLVPLVNPMWLESCVTNHSLQPVLPGN